MTSSFVEPTTANFGSLIIKNGTEVSNKIKELIDTTKPWLEIDAIAPSNEPETNSTEQTTAAFTVTDVALPSEQNGIEAGLTPEPIPF